MKSISVVFLLQKHRWERTHLHLEFTWYHSLTAKMRNCESQNNDPPSPTKKRSSPNAACMCLYYLGREMGMMVADEIKVADQPTLNR